MTVAAISPVITYIENGASLAFAVPYRFQASDDLVIDRTVGDVTTPLVIGRDYAVSGVDAANGGAVTLTATQAGGYLQIRRSTRAVQPTRYIPNDAFPAASHERGLDRVVMLAQEAKMGTDLLAARSFLAPPGEQPAAVPSLGRRADRLPAFNLNGDLSVLAPGVAGPSVVFLTPSGAPRVQPLTQVLAAAGIEVTDDGEITDIAVAIVDDGEQIL